MKGYTSHALRLLCAAVCMAAILLSSSPLVLAADNGGSSATGTVHAVGLTVSWDYGYSEDLFRLADDEYSHDLARLSLGLALAAVRDTPNPQEQDDNLISFLEQLGFGQIETDTYAKEPTSDSISYGFALLPMGDATVVALAVCGINYGPEWASNLTVGDSERSDGFQDAAQKVEAGLEDYMARHSVQGPLKLWISGYSRGAAVANIAAADLTDSGAFTDVYAYTFASPRTTRTPGDYPNIFNILQKNDMVTKIPLADWGYKRYGTDLFLVSPEIDLESEAVIARARELYRQTVGSDMVTNFEINNQLRILADYLYLLVPDSATYTKLLQPLILDILTRDDGTKDALLVLLEALERYSVDEEQHGEELKALRDYLGTLINIYYLQDGIGKLPANQWDPQFGTTNLFNEHFPYEYMSMMYASDDPDELFSENTRYVRLVIYGKAEAQIMSGDRVLKTVRADGTELVDGVEAPASLPDVECSNEKIVITLPADRSFTVSIKSKAFLPQTVTYTGLVFSGDTVRAQADDLYAFFMSCGQTARITTASNGRAIEPEGSDHTDVSEYIGTIYSPTTAMRLENNSVVHLTISGLVNKLLLIIVFLLVQAIVSIICTIVRRKKQRKRNTSVALIWHSVNAAVFAILELAMWYFVPILTVAKFIPAILVFLVIVIYAWKGYRENEKRFRSFLIPTAALAVFDIIESMLIGDFTTLKALIILVVYAGFLCAVHFFLWTGKKHEQPGEPEPTAG